MRKNFIFLIFASKTRATSCLRRSISRYFIKKISKVASPGAGRSFNLKSHQRTALYLCSFGIGRRSPERWATVPPPQPEWGFVTCAGQKFPGQIVSFRNCQPCFSPLELTIPRPNVLLSLLLKRVYQVQLKKTEFFTPRGEKFIGPLLL